MTFHPGAAACQEAGYRPCQRCRPETAPDLGSLIGYGEGLADKQWLLELEEALGRA
jgi:AraC family transcriptional regulator of adaptative response / DNA-3-methyladenine glycosylase II